MASGGTDAERVAAGHGTQRFELGSLDWRRVDPALVRSLLRAIDKPSDVGRLRRAYAELAGDPSEREVLARAAAELLGRGSISWRSVAELNAQLELIDECGELD